MLMHNPHIQSRIGYYVFIPAQATQVPVHAVHSEKALKGFNSAVQAMKVAATRKAKGPGPERNCRIEFMSTRGVVRTSGLPLTA